jgi:hypothetical protein
MKRHFKIMGFTLVEIIISSFIAILIMTVALTLLHAGRKAYDYSIHSFYLSEDSYYATEWIKKDLMQSSLSSIRIYPNKNNPLENPGVSMISAFDPKSGNFRFNDYGRPGWQAHVFYTLVPSGHQVELGDKTYRSGQLIRWELPLSKENNLPVPSAVLPSLFTQGINKRTIIQSVILPGENIIGDRKLDKFGGFKISFVRRDYGSGVETLSETNPADISDSDRGSYVTSGNTQLVQVDLVIQEISRTTGQPNVIDLPFRIKPRN